MGISFASIRWVREPFLMAAVDQPFKAVSYDVLARTFPREELFVHMQGAYHKYSLSERNNPQQYAEVVGQEPWRTFHKYLKSYEFITTVLRLVAEARGEGWPKASYTCRFEFSSLPADGGKLDPHTDIPSKVITLVVPMPREPWDPAWGGGTDMLRPNRTDTVYQDYKTPREAFDLVESFPYQPNVLNLFVKGDASWHSVGPIQGPAGVWRRTLTINIERTT